MTKEIVYDLLSMGSPGACVSQNLLFSSYKRLQDEKVGWSESVSLTEDRNNLVPKSAIVGRSRAWLGRAEVILEISGVRLPTCG